MADTASAIAEAFTNFIQFSWVGFAMEGSAVACAAGTEPAIAQTVRVTDGADTCKPRRVVIV
jgi:hypothetical protein